MPAPSEDTMIERKKLKVGIETVSNQQSTDFPGHWPGESHEWDLEYFKNNMRIEFQHEHANKLDLTFSLIGVDTSLANALRRILISEVPTLAIEDVFIYQNTSIIQDEVLAHRLGLVPLRGNHDALRWLKWYQKDEDVPDHEPKSDENCVRLSLNTECRWKEGGLEKAKQGVTDPDELYENHNVYARDFSFEPWERQTEKFGDDGVRSSHPDILVAKMRPGQHIELLMHAYKGIGQDHAKFSPVATATYRLLPTIDILKPIVGADAKKFARCFPKGVIRLDKVTSEDTSAHPEECAGKEGEAKAVVDNPSLDTVSRECLRHPEFADKVKLGRMRDHFIFRIESTGQWDSDELFLESIRLLKVKAARIKRGLTRTNAQAQ
ncbi:DNA-directed RNA polymeras-like proteines I and III subunit RPAC1 [Karstenula rhodostoma CBS 690.94]|uniref:DNA-directed RNA polymerases I and III subunit RPAC1 n=1 Tax=Karstenula rhodostoma CBS 690.94 TaxID=1392251 RepID=A0A9P4PE35_9PLEO|nr:DNA-directed RNA polymeras-like proteines I and III subunit RPAC1 [Karstenula rhodostoma CBS 690.94]